MKLPKKWAYMSDIDWQWRLTKGGQGIGGVTIEVDTARGNESSTETHADGKIYMKTPSLPLHLAAFRNWTVGKKLIRVRFYHYDEPNSDGTILTTVSQELEIVKGTPKLGFKKAGSVKKKAIFTLQDPQGYGLANKKLQISINGGKTITKTTNENGKVGILISKKGHFNYKVKYVGDNNLKAKTWTKSETIS